MNKATINRALRPFGLEIQNQRGAGYSYFTDTEGNQIGASVMVCYLNQATLHDWREYALQAWGQHESQSLPFDAVTCAKTLRATGNAVNARIILQSAASMGRDPLELWEVTAPFRNNPFQSS